MFIYVKFIIFFLGYKYSLRTVPSYNKNNILMYVYDLRVRSTSFGTFFLLAKDRLAQMYRKWHKAISIASSENSLCPTWERKQREALRR